MNHSRLSKKIFYCFVGAPGVGKGTQAEFLCKELNLKHISTGELLRQAVHVQSSLGLQVQNYMNQGKLVPDSIMIDLIADVFLRLSDKKGAVLDGFPRTKPQARALDQLLQKQNLKLSQCVLFTLDMNQLIKRITGRRVALKSGKIYHIEYKPPKNPGICDESGEKLIQRKDDTKEVVQVRLEDCLSQQKEVVEYYEQQSLVQEISAQGSPEEVYLRLIKTLELKRPV